MGFVPDYRDGVSADSHRLPYRPHLAGRPDIDDPATVPEGAHKVNRSGYPSPGQPFPLLSLRVLSLWGQHVDRSCFEKTLRGIPIFPVDSHPDYYLVRGLRALGGASCGHLSSTASISRFDFAKLQARRLRVSDLVGQRART